MLHLEKMVSNCNVHVELTFKRAFKCEHSAGNSPGLNAYQAVHRKNQIAHIPYQYDTSKRFLNPFYDAGTSAPNVIAFCHI